MAKYKVILFDVDGTLLDFHKTEKEALSNTFIELGIDLTDENADTYAEVNEALWKQLEKGEIDKDKLKTERFRLFFDKAGLNISDKLGSDTYIKYLCQSYFYIDGALDLCKNLADNHILAITTNGIAEVQHSRAEKSGLYKYFKHIFISDEIGYPKPHMEFFTHVFKEIEITNPKDVIIIGDSLTSDMKGGNNAGIATCWYNPDGLKNDTDSVCDYEIKTLDEFKDIVK